MPHKIIPIFYHHPNGKLRVEAPQPLLAETAVQSFHNVLKTEPEATKKYKRIYVHKKRGKPALAPPNKASVSFLLNSDQQ